MKKLLQTYARQLAQYNLERAQLRAERERLDLAFSQLCSPGRDELLLACGRWLARGFPAGAQPVVRGPFGLGARWWLDFRSSRGRLLGCLVLTFNVETLCLVTDEVEHAYAPGTVGAINGLGYREVPLSQFTRTQLVARAKKIKRYRAANK